MITFQLLSKDGSSLDDAEVLSGRWQAYIEGFVSDVETPGVATIKVRRPFLRRCAPSSISLLLFSPPLNRRNRSLHHTPTATATAVAGPAGPRPSPGSGVSAGAGTKLTKGPEQQHFYTRGGLEIKVCVRTYRLFYVSRTEDVLWRTPSPPECEGARAGAAKRDAARTRWLERFGPVGGVVASAPLVPVDELTLIISTG
jgi:paired amphipathic helix protein Sin3a